MDSAKRGDASMNAFIEAIGAMSEMTLIFYRNTLNAGATVEEAVRGRRVVLIDDSIVRGTTGARILSILREAGAREIHMRVSAPPFLYPCYYGTDIDSQDSLIACRKSVDEIAAAIGADSLGYLPLESLPGLAGSRDICRACFDGVYPTAVPAEGEGRKNRFEQRLSEREKRGIAP